MRRKSHMPVLLIAGVVIMLLFFNDETSVTRTRQYDAEIARLKKEIKTARDSTEFYKRQRDALYTDNDDLETVARENYHMQRPTEDIFIIE